jgi:hypothetical protein
MGRAALMLVVAGLLALAALEWREQSRIRRMQEGMQARRELAATMLAPPGTAPQAGISARAPIRVRPLPRRLARELRGEPDFQRLSHRCGVCHATPDPALHVAAEWPNIVARMSGTIDAAGLLPLSERDREAILRVLEEHAASGR